MGQSDLKSNLVEQLMNLRNGGDYIESCTIHTKEFNFGIRSVSGSVYFDEYVCALPWIDSVSMNVSMVELVCQK